jgi:hypothetical protein
MEEVVRGVRRGRSYETDEEEVDSEIREIYDNKGVEYADKDYAAKYIGRMLLDEAFVKFVGKVPKLISTYHDKYLK